MKIAYVCVVHAALAAWLGTSTACAQGPPSPVDLDWLRGECEGGALVHHADGRLYLTELESGRSVFLANGNQPEFSPDGARVAWIDGTRAKGRLRGGDPTIYVIAKGVEPEGGVHWLSDREVAVVLRRGAGAGWYGIGLDGSRREIPELTRLGTGGYECDVRQGEDGVWSYVADQGWKTSDGRSGRVPGTCSVSLSPDGRTVTSLHNPHERCDLTAIRPGGITRTLMWKYAGGYDNHRFASSDPRFLVAVDEHTDTMVVMTVDGERCTRVGTLGRADGGMYGDWTSRAVVPTSWLPDPEPHSDDGAGDDEAWPPRDEDAVFFWSHARASNTLSTRSPQESLCRLERRGAARPGPSFELLLDGGSAAAEEDVVARALDDLAASGNGALELVLACRDDETEDEAVVLELGGVLELTQKDGALRLWLTLTHGDPVTVDLGEIRASRPRHVAVSWRGRELTVHGDGREALRRALPASIAWSRTRSPALTVGARADGSGDWAGWVEGLALYRAALEPADVRASFAARSRRLAGRVPVERRELVGVLVRKPALPRADLYPNTLVAYDYRVGDEVVTAVHWGILDGEVQPGVRDRRLAASYRLRLEPWSGHPELERFKLAGSEGVRATPWFDATPPSSEAGVEARAD